MKKSMFGKAFAFLAAGALIFGAAGCDTGDDSYLPEVPTTYQELDSAYAGSGVKAVWNFESLSQQSNENNNVWHLKRSGSESAFPAAGLDSNGSIVQADGTSAEGATLTPSGLWNTNEKVLQAKKNTATMAALGSAGATLTLELEEQANIVILAKGAGSAEAARYLAITDEEDEIIVSKDNLSSGKDTLFALKGAAAGTYKIYVNGSSIYYIDLSIASANLKKPAEINELKLYVGTEEADKDGYSLELSVDSVTFKANNVYTKDGETKTEDNTADAIWTSSDESVATVKNGTVTAVSVGKTLIRARIGHFYDERWITVTPCMSTIATFFKDDNRPDDDVALGLTWDDNDDAKAALKKLSEVAVVGDLVEITEPAFAFSSTAIAMDWTKKESPIIGAKPESSVNTYKAGVIFWKNEQSTAWKENTLFATFSFKAGVSGTANLKQVTFATPSGNSNAGHYAVSVSVGDEETALVQCAKGNVTIPVDKAISKDTTVTVNLYVIAEKGELNSKASGKAKSFGFNEISATFKAE